MASISHRRAKELLDVAQDSELLSVDSQMLEHHLRHCADCRAYAVALNEFDLQLSNAARQRWPQGRLRQADLATAQEAVMRANGGGGWLSRITRATLNIGWASLVTLLLIGFVRVVAAFTQPDTLPAANEPVSGGSDKETRYIQTFERTDLNCDAATETIFLQREISSANAAVASDGLFPTTALIMQDATGASWTFAARDLGSDFIASQFLLQTSTCSSLLGVSTGGGATWFVIFGWDGARMTELLRAPGIPTNLAISDKPAKLVPGDHIEVRENSLVNRARCTGVNAIYEWTGFVFNKTSDAISSPFCMENQ